MGDFGLSIRHWAVWTVNTASSSHELLYFICVERRAAMYASSFSANDSEHMNKKNNIARYAYEANTYRTLTLSNALALSRINSNNMISINFDKFLRTQTHSHSNSRLSTLSLRFSLFRRANKQPKQERSTTDNVEMDTKKHNF